MGWRPPASAAGFHPIRLDKRTKGAETWLTTHGPASWRTESR